MAEMMDFLEDQPPDPNNVLQTPSFAQIGWMKRNVQAIGGVLLAGVCRPRGIAYPVDGQQASGRTVMVNTAGCGNETLALIPQEDGEAAKVCLVCDGAIEWPRLESAEATGPPPPPEGPFDAHWVPNRPADT